MSLSVSLYFPLVHRVTQPPPPGNELRALTATPTPDPSVWAFSDINDRVFSPSTLNPEEKHDHASPREWLRRGLGPMQSALLL